MLKTTKEFDFVYKNSYKFRNECLDVCILKPALVRDFCAKFGRIQSDFVGFSVSKKVGIAVERNLIKRRLRAICREFFKISNSSLGMQFAPFSHKTSLDEPQVLSRSFHAKTAQSHTANTSIVYDDKIVESAPNRLTLRSEVSKSRESRAQSESIAKKRIHKLDSPLQHCDSYNLDSRDLDSSLRATRFAQNDKMWADSRNDKNRTNLICIFIAKNGILQMPFGALKESIFTTLKRQINFRSDSRKNKRDFANRTNLKNQNVANLKSTNHANRAHTKALQK